MTVGVNMHVQFAEVYLTIAGKLHAKYDDNPGVLHSLVSKLRDAAVVQLITAKMIEQKVKYGQLDVDDLNSSKALLAAKQLLTSRYPGLDWDNSWRYVSSREAQDVIARLITDSESTSRIEITRTERLAELQLTVAQLYPDLVLDENPGQTLLEGEWKDEVHAVISRLSSRRPPDDD